MSGSSAHPQPRFGYAVAFLERAIRRSLSLALRPLELTVAQYTVLWLLDHHEGLSNAQLARRAYISPQAMSEVLRHLEGRGLAQRSPSPDHARVQPARLTAEGRLILDRCETAVDAMEDELLSDVPQERRTELIEMFMRAGRRIETHKEREQGRSLPATMDPDIPEDRSNR